MKKPRAAIYLRVSTEEQTLDNQRPDVVFREMQRIKQGTKYARSLFPNEAA